jgi:hypothetical protein
MPTDYTPQQKKKVSFEPSGVIYPNEILKQVLIESRKEGIGNIQ